MIGRTLKLQLPTLQTNFLRRWSFFSGYLLIFPLLLQFVPVMISGSVTAWLNWSGALAARIFLAAVFVFCLVRIRSRAAYIFMGLITLATGVVNLLDIYLLVNFGTVFDYSMWQLVRIAPSHEVSGFFRLFFCRFTTLLILLVYPLAGVIIFCIKKNRLLYITIAFSTLLLLFIFNCCGANFPRAAPDAPGKRLVSFVQQWQDSGMLRQIDISNKNLQAENTEKEALYVLVIGESHSRRRSSVYGYMRNTMPEMKKLFLQQKIFRFDDAVTPHIMTHLALPQMLTAIPPGNEKPFYEHPNILDIFRSSGFKVWYIYNQMPDESRKLPFLAIARRADKFISLSNPVKQYDSIIPDLLQKLINDPARKKFIIIHLLGNHWEYAKTFPAGMKKFKGMPPDANLSQLKKYDIVNDYDNSLLHVDKVLHKLISTVEQTEKNAFLLYLPDHGEALYEEDDFVGHTDLFPNASTAEIPLLLWISERYAVPGTRESIKRALKRPFFSADLPHLLMELSRIRTSCFIPERSIINPCYKKMPRRVSTRSIDYDTMKNKSQVISPMQ